VSNNGFDSVAANPPAASPVPAENALGAIKHVVYIIKENRTFDEVFGDLHPGDASFACVPAMARWGETAEVQDKTAPTVADGHVSPNHHALARRFAISD